MGIIGPQLGIKISIGECCSGTAFPKSKTAKTTRPLTGKPEFISLGCCSKFIVPPMAPLLNPALCPPFCNSNRSFGQRGIREASTTPFIGLCRFTPSHNTGLRLVVPCRNGSQSTWSHYAQCNTVFFCNSLVARLLTLICGRVSDFQTA